MDSHDPSRSSEDHDVHEELFLDDLDCFVILVVVEIFVMTRDDLLITVERIFLPRMPS
jgi:hypothetical protein